MHCPLYKTWLLRHPAQLPVESGIVPAAQIPQTPLVLPKPE